MGRSPCSAYAVFISTAMLSQVCEAPAKIVPGDRITWLRVSPGTKPFMTFIGGEVGIERDLQLLAEARRIAPALRTGTSDVETMTADSDEVFAVLRRDGEHVALVLVNLSPLPTNGRVRLKGAEFSLLLSTIVGPVGGSAAAVDDAITYDLPAHAWCVLATIEGA